MSNPALQNQHPTFDTADLEIIGQLQNDDVPGEFSNESADTTTSAPALAATAPAAAPAAAGAEPAAPVADTGTPAAAAETPRGDTRAALRASRFAEKRSRDEAEELRRQLADKDALIADIKAGNAPVDSNITDAELAALDEDFPLQAKIVRNQRELERKLAAVAPKAAEQSPEEFMPAVYDPRIQEVIDGQPDLLAWQYSEADQDKFERAIAYDSALNVDPDWKGKTSAERFNEAARRTRIAFNLSAAPAAPRIDPATAVANAELKSPGGISDFKGGVTGSPPTPNFAKMSDEAVMASLVPE